MKSILPFIPTIRFALIALTLFALSLREASAQVPQIINYQGKVIAGGTPFTGIGQFKFALVNSDGTTSYWSHDGTSAAGSAPTTAVSLPVANGLYVVPLGDTGIANMSAVPATAFANSDVRLRIWFDDGSNGLELLAPDQRITSVGYAMVAGSLSSNTAPSPPTVGNAGTVYFNSTDSRLYYSDGTSWLPVGSSQAVYRWAVWSTNQQAEGGGAWYFGNNATLTAGVSPSL